jgi:DNA-directed RNA polymerase subunit N (RpoN/RPB10)
MVSIRCCQCGVSNSYKFKEFEAAQSIEEKDVPDRNDENHNFQIPSNH